MAAIDTRVDAGKPSRVLEVLRECGALPRLPETELNRGHVNFGQTPIKSRL